MDAASIAGLISAGAAVLSVAGASFAWGRESLSTRARNEAQLARDEARKASVRAEEQMRAVKRIADSLQPDPFEVIRDSTSMFTLVERAGMEHVISRWVNKDDFTHPQGLDCPLTVSPHQSVRVIASAAYGRPIPAEFVLRLEDGQPCMFESRAEPDSDHSEYLDTRGSRSRDFDNHIVIPQTVSAYLLGVRGHAATALLPRTFMD